MKRNRVGREKGDAFTNRLFFFLTSQQLKVRSIIPLRQTVFLIHCDDASYIMKGYDTYEKMKQQQLFLQYLQQTGFLLTAYLKRFPLGTWYRVFDGRYWLLFQHVVHDHAFSFERERDRQQALQTLYTYEQHAHMLPQALCTLVPRLPWLEKWELRKQKFQYHQAYVTSLLSNHITEQLLYWAEYALLELSSINVSHLPHGFVHGDIIEHNFVTSHMVYLIDFDCVSFGPILYDYVKYCYGVLPFLQWSWEHLQRYKELEAFIQSRPFLLSLMFPGDILREWDYFLSLPYSLQKRFQAQLISFTENDAKLRFAFVEKLQNVIT